MKKNMPKHSAGERKLLRQNLSTAKRLYPGLPKQQLSVLRDLTATLHLDAALVKAYATDFCGTKTLREASREQVENFVTHLADWAEKDRNALLCQLNSYLGSKEGAA